MVSLGLDTEPEKVEARLWGQWPLLPPPPRLGEPQCPPTGSSSAPAVPWFSSRPPCTPWGRPSLGALLFWGHTCADPDPWQSQAGRLWGTSWGSATVESVATSPLPTIEDPVHGEALGPRL